MASPAAKLSYQRLKHEIWFDEEETVIQRLRQSRLRRVAIKKKVRVKIPSLRRFMKRKARQVKIAWIKVCKRLRESRSHFGDLFAGNYMFMQVTPTPLQYGGGDHIGGNNYYKTSAKGYGNNLGLCSSRLSNVPKVA